jgi:alcohol dehydrogenase class IV
MQFEFSTASKIIFGPGKFKSIGDITEKLGNKCLIICGAPQDHLKKLLKILDAMSIMYETYMITHEPTVNMIQEYVRDTRKTKVDVIIGIGGGSALDTAKAIAALKTNPGDLTDYLEVIGLKKPLSFPSIPLVAIPTTAGTGSEVTKNAVISIPTHKVKVSLRSDFLLPSIALIDPELTISLPQKLTATTGLDALTQLIEAYTCKNPNPIIDSLCLDGIKRISRSIFKAFDDGNDLSAREDMCLASLLSGIALANAKLGAVHGLAGPIGGLISASHGSICASLLSNVMSANIHALQDRNPNHPVLERYTQVSRVLNQDPMALTDSGINWVHNFCLHSDIQHLSSLGLSEAHFEGLIESAQRSSSMKGNPITLFKHEIRRILQESL